MKSIKILALSILQTLLFTLIGYLFIRLFFNITWGNAASIGIIGGADGPTAIFLANILDVSVFFQYSYLMMFLLFLLVNLSALLSNKTVSVILSVVSFIFAFAGIYFVLSAIAAWLWIVMILITAAFMVVGYKLTQSIKNRKRLA